MVIDDYHWSTLVERPMQRTFAWMERFYRLAWIIPLIAAIYFTWTAWTAAPFLSYKNIPFPPQLSKVPAGQTIPLFVHRCSSADKRMTYNMTRTLYPVNGIGTDRGPYVMPEAVVQIEPGCHQEISLINRIPSEVAPGRYYIVGLAAIQGTIRTVYVEWTSQPFDVTEPIK